MVALAPLMMTGCNDCNPKDPSESFLDTTIKNVDGSGLSVSVLSELKAVSSIAIDRTSANKDEPGAGRYDLTYDTLEISGAAADSLQQKAKIWRQGNPRTGDFSKALGLLFHEAHHRKFEKAPKPAWHKEALKKFSAASDHGLNERASEQLVDEAIGEFVEKSVTQFADTYTRLAAALEKGDQSKIASLREEYNAAQQALGKKPLGYWEARQPGNPLADPKRFNTKITLTPNMIAYGNSVTGLSGSFDTDFAKQLRKTQLPKSP
jgi:hypothetical protein